MNRAIILQNNQPSNATNQSIALAGLQGWSKLKAEKFETLSGLYLYLYSYIHIHFYVSTEVFDLLYLYLYPSQV